MVVAVSAPGVVVPPAAAEVAGAASLDEVGAGALVAVGAVVAVVADPALLEVELDESELHATSTPAHAMATILAAFAALTIRPEPILLGQR